MHRVDVLDKGYVELVDSMGDQFRILEAARVSTGSQVRKGNEKDRGLIRYLYFNKHTSPFEMVEFTFKMKMPIFVARQHIRHRTAGLNEKSGRYSVMDNEFYFPKLGRIQKQSTTNNQGSEDGFDKEIQYAVQGIVAEAALDSEEAYEFMLERDVSRELARIVLPLNTYTEMFWKIDLHNLLHYLSLRDHAHAQYEIREYAEAILAILNGMENLEWVMEAFQDYRKAYTEFEKMLVRVRKEPNYVELLRMFGDFTSRYDYDEAFDIVHNRIGLGSL